MRTLTAVLIVAGLASSAVHAQSKKDDPEKTLAAALRNIQKKDQLEQRIQAAMELADFGPKAEAAVPDLLDCLQTKNEDLRLNAAIALGKIGKIAVPAVAKLLTDNDIDTRYYAVFTIAAIGPDAKETLPTIIKLTGDKNEGIRRKAVYALGRLAGDPNKAIADLKIGDLHIIEVLVKAFKDKDDDVRQAAGDALPKFGKIVMPYLLGLLKEKNAAVRLQAATSLGDMGSDARDAVPALRERYLAKDSENAHHYAMVLGKIGKSALPALEAGFKDERPHVRSAASQALQQMGGDGVGILVDALGDKNVEVRRLASQTLWPMRIGDKSVVIALAYALSDTDHSVRQNAMNALAQLGAQAKLGAPKIKDALLDTDANIRIQAFYLLQQLGDDPRPILKKAIAGKDDKVRINTAGLMVSVSFDVNDALPILTAALKHDDSALRLNAALALAQRQLEADKVMPVFIDGLKHKTAGVRSQAAQGLGMLQNRAAAHAPKLAELLKDADPNVRQQAINALQNVRGTPEAVLPVLTAIYKEGPDANRQYVLQVAWLYGGKAKDLIFDGLKAKDAGVKQQAVFAVNNLQGDLTEALPALVALLKEKDGAINRQQIIWVLSRGGASAAPHLGELLKDKDGDLRAAAMQALRNMGQNAAKALPAIKAAAKDSDPNIRLNALVILATVGGEGPAFLVKHFDSEKDANTRAGILQNLAYSGQAKHAVPLLKSAIADPSPHVRQSTVNLLGYFRDSKEGFEVFAIALKDKEANIRIQAAYNAGSYGNKAWDPLADALKSAKDSGFRQAILQGMMGTQFKSKTALAPLTDCLSDGNVTVRQWACGVLGNIGPDAADALPALQKLTNDPNQAVQNSARNAIQQIEPRKK